MAVEFCRQNNISPSSKQIEQLFPTVLSKISEQNPRIRTSAFTLLLELTQESPNLILHLVYKPVNLQSKPVIPPKLLKSRVEAAMKVLDHETLPEGQAVLAFTKPLFEHSNGDVRDTARLCCLYYYYRVKNNGDDVNAVRKVIMASVKGMKAQVIQALEKGMDDIDSGSWTTPPLQAGSSSNSASVNLSARRKSVKKSDVAPKVETRRKSDVAKTGIQRKSIHDETSPRTARKSIPDEQTVKIARKSVSDEASPRPARKSIQEEPVVKGVRKSIQEEPGKKGARKSIQETGKMVDDGKKKIVRVASPHPEENVIASPPLSPSSRLPVPKKSESHTKTKPGSQPPTSASKRPSQAEVMSNAWNIDK
jgi:hypothetical protein